MTHLPSLPATAALFDVFKAYPEAARPLLAYHEILMRGPSSLSVAARERIAAYVSALNGCEYCRVIHAAAAEALAVTSDEGEARLAPILTLVETLTRTPNRDPATEARAVLSAGWDEQALFDAVSICGLFNLMNRLVAGLGNRGRTRIPADGRAAASRGRLCRVGGGARSAMTILASPP